MRTHKRAAARRHKVRAETSNSLPTFEALEPRVLLSYADLWPLGADVGADAWQGENVAVYAPGPGAGPLDFHAVYSEDGQSGDGESGGDSGGGTGVLISGVPAYRWRYGCGPTAAGMILGYWDGQGYDSLVDGSAATQTAAVNQMMASSEHYADYSQPIDSRNTGILNDKSSTGGAHENNSLADYMETSFSSRSNYYGWSWFSDIDNALEDYAAVRGYTDADAWNRTWGSFDWDMYTQAIDAGSPVGLIVDTNGDGWTDHFITAIGYNADTNQYAAHNTWDGSVHWYSFAQMASGQNWGIYGATFFDPGTASSDGVAPTATVAASDVTTSGDAAYTFTVTYWDNVGVDVSDLDGSDVRVTGPNGFAQTASFVGVDGSSDGTPRTATYRITAPDGGWDLADNGTYTVSLQAGQVSDTSGNLAAAGALGTFQVAVADLTAPTAALTAAAFAEAGAAVYTFQVTYSDNVAVDVSDIDNSDIRVTGPNGYSQYASLVGIDVGTDGTPRTATYQIAAPGGEWSRPDNGVYTISLRASQVSDTSGNLAAATTLGTFAVDVADNVAPSAVLDASAYTDPGSNTYTFTVTYSDNEAVDVSDLGSTDIRVTGPNGFSQYATFVGVDVDSDGTPRTAIYRITAPGGTWDLADNGTYTISLLAGQVSDLSGNLVPAAALGTFQAAATDTTSPAADLTAADILEAGATVHTFQVVYADNVAVDVSDLDNSDIQVTGPNGYSQYATLVNVDVDSDGTPRTATYRITAPGGEWNRADNGTYTVSLRSGQVSDTSGNLAAAGALGTFTVNVPDAIAPSAVLVATDLTSTGSSTYTFTVTYSDNEAVDVSDLDGSDVRVTGPNGYSRYATFVGVDVNNDGTPRTATYRITAPGGEWGRADNGAYTVSLRAGQVSDVSGNLAAAGSLGTFAVNVPDVAAPSADLVATDVTSTGSSTYTFTVTYSDNEAVDVSDLGGSDVRVTGPNGFSQYATLVDVDVDSDGTPRTATYRITAPGGAWDLADNGTYTVSLLAGQVSDTSGNLTPAGVLGTFQAASSDVVAPTADLTVANIAEAGATVHTFQVVYADNVGIDVSDIDNSDIQVTGPNGYSQYATLVDVSIDGDGTPRTATYRITAPGGEWDRADNGAYTVSLRPGQVSDTSGNLAAAAVLGTFTVNVPDAVAPSAVLAVTNITSSGSGTHTFTVTYSDNEAVDVSDLGGTDIRVTGPDGYSQYATFVGVDVNSDGTPRTATYRITAPGGEWDRADNGTYTVSLLAGQVSDAFGNLAPASALGTFSVAVPDQGVPWAVIDAANITSSGSGTHTFTVTYSDNEAVDVSDLDGSDIRVTGPNGYSQYATFVGVDVDNDGTPRTATYRITAPGGEWDRADNGTYSVSLLAGQVSDASGNLAAAATLGTFSASIPDVSIPSAVVDAANVTSPGTSTYTFTVTYSDNEAVDVSDLGHTDVRVTGPNGFSQYATFVGVNVNADGTPRTATYRITAPGGEWDFTDAGLYAISLQAGQVSDASGNLVPAGQLGTFSVDLAAPQPEPEPEPDTPSQTFGTVNGVSGVRLTLPGANGRRVTYAIKGVGYGQIEGEAGAEQIVLYGTNSKSSLIITSEVSGAAVGDIIVNGSIGTLSLRDINLVGNVVVTGTLSQFLANDVLGPCTITIGPPASYRDSVTFRMRNVEELSIDSKTPIRSITVANWADADAVTDNITAPSLGRLQVRAAKGAANSGSFQAGLSLTGNTLPGAKVKATLGSVRIGNNLKNADWNITGNVGVVSALGVIENWTLTTASDVRGLRLGTVISADLDVNGHIGQIQAARWDNGLVSAATAGSIRTRGDKTTGARGDFGADVALSGPGGGIGLTLGSARIAGAIVDADWDITGDAGKMQVDWWGAGSSLTVAQRRAQGSQFATAAGSLAKLRIGGYDEQNDGVAFGVTAANFGRGVQVGRAKFSAADLPFVDGDFQMAPF